MKASVIIEAELFTTGSGFYISPHLIITNEHVLQGLASTTVNFKNKAGQSCTGTIVSKGAKDTDYMGFAIKARDVERFVERSGEVL